jgi:DNA-binding GntR family transcriptional regulator
MGAAPKLIHKPGHPPSGLYEILREQIANHEIPPGARLGEQALADEFKVSRARVRDALAMLAQRGLVERIPARGAVVRHLDLAVAVQVLELRELLEALAARLATRNAPPDHWNDLISTFEALTTARRSRDSLQTYIRNYELFRHRIVVAADSPPLADTLAALHDKTKMVMRRVLIVSDRTQRAMSEHLHVLKAMRDKDAEMAELLRRRSLSSARKYLEQYRDVLF